MSPRAQRVVLRAVCLVLFALGIVAATSTAPEWATGDTTTPDAAKERFDEVATSAGYTITGKRRTVDLKFGPSSSDISIRREAADQFGTRSTDWLTAQGLGLVSTVEAPASHPAGTAGILNVSADMNGDVVAIEFTSSDVADFIKPGASEVDAEEYRAIAALLLDEGESLGDAGYAQIGAQKFLVFPVIGASPPESITAVEPAGIKLVNRRPGTPDDISAYYDRVLTVSHIATRGLSVLLKFSIAAFFLALFIVLVVRRAIGLRTGIMLGVLVFVTSAAGGLDEVGPAWILWLRVAFSFVVALWCGLVWSAAESWLRAVKPDVLQTVDTVASFQPGPRSARSLLDGWFAGLGLAGAILLVESIHARFGMLSTSSAALDLPIFGTQTPLSHAVLLSGSILAAAAAAHYFRDRSESVVATALMAFVIYPTLDLAHWGTKLGTALLMALVFRAILTRSGASSVFAATLNLLAAPATVFAVKHSDWMPYSTMSGFALVSAPLVVALIGLGKRADEETKQIITPHFMRRLSEERRVQYEMGLLAEMQIRMLPDRSPSIEGWDIAAHSTLASEVGGDLYDYLEDDGGNLWIAIGDVSGHGYQCAIAQAMTKASLTSLVSASRSPASILAQMDGVLRRGGSARTFTSLALAKLDLASGKVVLSNAGNPYPVHVTVDGRVQEIELPSLPLGMGPAREYVDVELLIGDRDYLLFYSDGLVEVRNRNDEMLGFDRPASIVRMRRGQPAAEIVAGLERAWRDHLGEGEVQDDTTIVLIKRV